MSDTNSLPSRELGRARRRYYLYSVFNGIAFKLLAGYILTLYVLRLGAGNSLVGLLSSFMYLSMAFLFLGRPLVPRFGAVRVLGVFWGLRFLAMIPVLFTVLPAVRANRPLAFTLVTVGAFGFHMFKGIALVSHQPVLGEIASGRDRGTVLSRIQFFNQVFSLGAWLVIAWALGEDAPLGVYAIIFGVGILVGLLAAGTFLGLPEPRLAERGFSESLLPGLRRGMDNPGFRRLMPVLFVRSMATAMAAPFLTVYFKRFYAHVDGDIIIFALVGGVGVLIMALIAGFLMDRVGAKPLFSTFAGVAGLVLVLIPAGGVHTTGILYWLIPAVVFLFWNMGVMGMNNCAQDYFFATVPPEERLNLGIFYNAILGLAGFLGALGGGLLLDGLIVVLPAADHIVFRLYYGVVIGGFVVVELLVYRLPDIGAYSVLNTLSIIFSPRDLRAIRLLRRLGRSRTAGEEQAALQALGRSPSPVSTSELVAKLNSPSFSVRTLALEALREQPMTLDLTDALIREIKHHRYTTAHRAAEIIGNRGLAEAAPELRDALRSDDFMLCGKAMVALARLGDHRGLAMTQAVFAETDNPRLIIHGAKALAIYGDLTLVEVLISRLAHKSAPFVRDEIILAIAEIAGVGDWFYPLYTVFLDSRTGGIQELRGELPTDASADAIELVAGVIRGGPSFGTVAERFLKDNTAVSRVNSELLPWVVDESVMAFSRFRFLVAALAVEPLSAGN